MKAGVGLPVNEGNPDDSSSRPRCPCHQHERGDSGGGVGNLDNAFTKQSALDSTVTEGCSQSGRV